MSYDVGGAKSDGHGGAESSCQKHLAMLSLAGASSCSEINCVIPTEYFWSVHSPSCSGQLGSARLAV